MHVTKNTKLTTTLLIATYNWSSALSVVLNSILRQSVAPTEIIIADDGSREDTAQLIKEFNKTHNLAIKHVWHPDAGFRKTLILNKAIQQSCASYLIQIDGDIVMHSHFIRDHIAAAEEGFFVQGSRAMLTKKLTEKVVSCNSFKLHALSRGMHTRFNAIHCPRLAFIFSCNPTSSHNVKGCNMAFFRADFIRINGYYNGFEGWGFEDYEFAERLINSGIKKKRLKWAAVSYHLFHPLCSRKNFRSNEIIYEETVAQKKTYRIPGYHEISAQKAHHYGCSE
ncbi:glycosyltransferase family 2 protein [Sphingobacteriaceae bacterium WQ 2009]|uniref:Glycosyltransferase family 2 protein n=1 Tax=Rhinopithecimicrobium faecis TaxID=2820698 RepID=A0A8T4HBG7_9SPHI|nr:glycosyltransferase family 2 protein [Sphingobacteriaceae bacterium WQ 2009]